MGIALHLCALLLALACWPLSVMAWMTWREP